MKTKAGPMVPAVDLAVMNMPANLNSVQVFSADATDSALVEVMKEMKNYAASGITEDELTFMKSSYWSA